MPPWLLWLLLIVVATAIAQYNLVQLRDRALERTWALVAMQRRRWHALIAALLPPDDQRIAGLLAAAESAGNPRDAHHTDVRLAEGLAEIETGLTGEQREALAAQAGRLAQAREAYALAAADQHRLLGGRVGRITAFLLQKQPAEVWEG